MLVERRDAGDAAERVAQGLAHNAAADPLRHSHLHCRGSNGGRQRGSAASCAQTGSSGIGQHVKQHQDTLGGKPLQNFGECRITSITIFKFLYFFSIKVCITFAFYCNCIEVQN